MSDALIEFYVLYTHEIHCILLSDGFCFRLLPSSLSCPVRSSVLSRHVGCKEATARHAGERLQDIVWVGEQGRKKDGDGHEGMESMRLLCENDFRRERGSRA